MAIIDRIKNILLTPKTEWPVIASENTLTAELLKGYVAPLAAIPAICGFIGGSLIGYGAFGASFRVPIVAGIGGAIFGYAMSFASVFLISFIVSALAPTFGAEKSASQAMKLTVYSFTASWLGGVFLMLPGLRLIGVLFALYGVFLLYLGLPRLMKCPQDRAIGYTVVILIAAIVVFVVVGAVANVIGGIGGSASSMFGGMGDRTRPSPDVTIDKDSNLGKLEAFGKKMEETSKKMEAAQKSGNQEEAMKAAMSGLGVVLGGGKSVEALDIEKLKRLVPESFAGLPRKSSRSEKSELLGIMVSKAEAEYGDSAGKSVRLEITDTGGASGIMGLASWAGVQGEKEDQYGTERTQRINGRLVHEKSAKSGGGEYGVVVADRFMVDAKSSNVDLNALKSAVGGLDLGKLESMKDEGVKK